MIDNDAAGVVFTAMQALKPFDVDGVRWSVTTYEQHGGITMLHGVRQLDFHRDAYQDDCDRRYVGESRTNEYVTITLDADSSCIDSADCMRLFRVKVTTEIEVDSSVPGWARNVRELPCHSSTKR